MRTTVVKSASRVLDILELIAATPRPLRLSEVAARIGIPKSSAFALLSTLVEKGYAEELAAGYQLVGSLQEYGWIGGQMAGLVRVAPPVMAELARSSGESAFLGTLTIDGEMRYLRKALSPNPIRYDTDLELPRAAYCTSIGLIMLADTADSYLDNYFKSTELVAITPYTETKIDAIRAIIDQVRAQGYIRTVNSHFEGVAGVAAPIRSSGGRVLAGLALIGPTERFDSRLESHIEAVTEAAKVISVTLSQRSAPQDNASETVGAAR